MGGHREIRIELRDIETFARRFYAGLDFAHNESHVERVVANALMLQAREGGLRDLIEAGAWLHQFHDNLGELRDGLSALSISEALRREVYEIVEVCRPHKIGKSASLEARVVFDADALELIGPFGSVRELLCNFHWRKLSWEESVENCQRVQGLFVDSLQTDSARIVARDLVAVNSQFWCVYRKELKRTNQI